MADITMLPEIELRLDLEASINDALACNTALSIGVFDYDSDDGTHSIQERLNCNLNFIAIITAELDRRKEANGSV